MIKPSLALFGAFAASTYPLTAHGASCRYLPSDSAWPSAAKWNALNTTVGGRLAATVPYASVCHGATYDAVKCQFVKDNWISTLYHEESASSLMAPYYQNQSCDPFTPVSKPCELGNYVSYSIDASSAADVAAGIKFANANNIRLVTKNTGHDFLGRSAGTGGLGIWTHNLRTSEFISSYASSAYNGPAIKFGAGIRGFEAIDTANANGVRVIGGFCPTVGVVGGYLQGGGHGPLTSTHGLAADQALEFEVVTANGSVVTASPTKNADLYWALSGGGGSTYGIVVSATIRAFTDGAIGGGVLAFSRTNVSTDKVYEMLGYAFDLTPALADQGIQFAIQVTKTAFQMGPFTGPGKTGEEIRAALKPLTDKLDAAGIIYVLQVTTLPNYKTHFETFLGPSPVGKYSANAMPGSRLIPRTSITNNRPALVQATRDITENTATFISFLAYNVTKSSTKAPVADNAVLPQWRSTALHALGTFYWNFTAPQSENLANEAQLQNYIVPKLRAAVPADAGTYLNEAEVGIKNWKQDFFGTNYNKLRLIKRKYDPTDLFYAEYMVGSDAWYRASDGRLCRT